jgi:hypothetical protein
MPTDPERVKKIIAPGETRGKREMPEPFNPGRVE